MTDSMTPKRQHAWKRAGLALRELRELVETEALGEKEDSNDTLDALDRACDEFDDAANTETMSLTLGEPFTRWTVSLPSGAGMDIYVPNTADADNFVHAMLELGELSAYGETVEEVPLP
jgi:hypothetical protein